MLIYSNNTIWTSFMIFYKGVMLLTDWASTGMFWSRWLVVEDAGCWRDLGRARGQYLYTGNVSEWLKRVQVVVDKHMEAGACY